ncbi:MAG: hypothetical protein HQL88_03740 [Magnetococcales bacterium]|nr:hypothetical protein [Magnetococcales bacterium]
MIKRQLFNQQVWSLPMQHTIRTWRAALISGLLLGMPQRLSAASPQENETPPDWLAYLESLAAEHTGALLGVMVLLGLLFALRRRRAHLLARAAAAAQSSGRRRAQQTAVAVTTPPAEAVEVAAVEPPRPTPSPLPADLPPLLIEEELCLGRQKTMALLDGYLADPQVAVVCLLAPAGVGKSCLLRHWRKARGGHDFFWSFSERAGQPHGTGSGHFFRQALAFFSPEEPLPANPEARAQSLLRALLGGSRERTAATAGLMLLDGVEALHWGQEGMGGGCFADPGMHALARLLGNVAGDCSHRLLVLASQRPIVELAPLRGGVYRELPLENLKENEATQLLHELGVRGKFADFRPVVKGVRGHTLSITLLGRLIARYYQGSMANKDALSPLWATGAGVETALERLLEHYDKQIWPQEGLQHAFLRLLALLQRPMEEAAVGALCQAVPSLRAAGVEVLAALRNELQQAGLLRVTSAAVPLFWPLHPLVAAHYTRHWQAADSAGWQQAQRALARHWAVAAQGGDPEAMEQALGHAGLGGDYPWALQQWRAGRSGGGRGVASGSEKGAAVSDELPLLAAFFPQGWQALPSEAGLAAVESGELLRETANALLAAGRLTEAVAVQRILWRSEQEGAEGAARAVALCDLLLPMGALAEALATAKQGIQQAAGGEAFWPMALQALQGAILQQMGEMGGSLAALQQAEILERARQPGTPRLLGVQGKYYCDLLLEQARTLADREAVLRRTEEFFRWRVPGDPVQEVAMEHLSMGRALAALGRATEGLAQLGQAIAVLHGAGLDHLLAECLLRRGEVLRQCGELAAARRDAEEALILVERGGLALWGVDGWLLASHLSLDNGQLADAEAGLARVEAGIAALGYGRRLVEAHLLRARLWQVQKQFEAARQERDQARQQLEVQGQWSLLFVLEQELAGL